MAALVNRSSSGGARLAVFTALLVLAVSACRETSGPRSPGLHIIAGAGVRDSINKTLASPLTVLLLDENGHPLGNAAVRFETVTRTSDGFGYRVYVNGRKTYGLVDTSYTDQSGLASTYIRFNGEAGEAKVTITVPVLGYRDTARYTITPGEPVAIVLKPRDSVTYVGNGYTLSGTVVDVGGNSRSEPLTFSVRSGPASIDANTGALEGLAIGRAVILATGAGKTDSAMVTIAPQGQLALERFYAGNGSPEGIVVTGVDGAGYRTIAPGINNEQTPQGLSWLPDGSAIVLTRGVRVRLLAPDGTERTVVEMAGGTIGARPTRDGQQIYFGYLGSDIDAPGLYRVNVDGSNLQPLGPSASVTSASPSPDGRFVAYVTYGSVHIFEVAAGQDRTTPGAVIALGANQAAWSPNADLIAVSVEPNISLLHSDGSLARPLASGFYSVHWIDWSPDGRWIAVSAAGPTVTLIDTQTGEQLRLTDLLSHGEAAWRP